MTNLATNKLHRKIIALPLTSPLSKKLRKPAAKSIKTDSVLEITIATNLDKAISKHTELIQLMQRPDGMALSELMKLTNWQAHSIRGWISGTLRKKLGLVVTRLKSAADETCYRIESVAVVSQ